MKHNPLDYLLHDAIMYRHNSPVFKQFFNLLTDHPIGVYHWPEWSGPAGGVHLSADGNFGPEAPHFFLFGKQDIVAGYHQPCVVTASEYSTKDVWPSRCAWYLRGVLVYRLDEDNFDAIGLMRSVSGDYNLPEIQLRFTRVEDSWMWYRATTGFINPYVYAPVVDELTAAGVEALDEAVEYYGNVLSLFLGGYHSWLQCDGRWEERAPKHARVKKDKNGKIKKFYQMASSGHMTFVPEHTNDEQEIVDQGTAVQ